MSVASIVSSRSTCLRRKVGAVIVKDKRMLATGYNGAPSGIRHCEVVGCLREKLKISSGERHELCRGLHAEMNAIIQASLYGVPIAGAVLYSTNHPCVMCAKMIINAGIKKVVILGDYPDKFARSLLKEADIKVVKGEKQNGMEKLGGKKL